MAAMEDMLGWLFIGMLVCLIAFIIYLAVKPKNRFQASFDVFTKKKQVQAVGRYLSTGVAVLVGVLLFGGVVELLIQSATTGLLSGWYPRTREIIVYAEASKWINGELKPCFSKGTPEKSELTSIVCDSDTNESHALNVRFWGSITTDGPKLWKCRRDETSVSCKLQR